jgi:arylsulfatase A-like enzyme
MIVAVLLTLAAAPNVILISGDTLRADYLSTYGYPLTTSPNLDRLAADSLLFEDAVCEIPLTSPSFGAMMSSQFPRTTGTYRNGLTMPEDVPLVAENFQQAGYATIGVQSNWTLKGKLSGLHRGFDTYDDGFHKKRWGVIKSERDGKEVSDRALALLEQWDQSKPLFAWFHYSDPHAPYKMHKNFDVVGKPLKGLSKQEKVRAKYASEIAYMDHHIGHVLDALPTENTFVVFVGDHGESLYEHGYLGHGRRINQPCMHIPFFIHGPGIAPGRSKAPVRGIDVGTTLLGLAGLKQADTMLGLNVAAAAPTERPRVIETYGGAVPNIPGAEEVMTAMGPQRQGVLHQGWKLVRDGSKVALYNLNEDPAESNDVSDDQPERTTQLSQHIDTWAEQFARENSDKAALTDADLEALDSLGYVE